MRAPELEVLALAKAGYSAEARASKVLQIHGDEVTVSLPEYYSGKVAASHAEGPLREPSAAEKPERHAPAGRDSRCIGLTQAPRGRG